jgi:hypothetical protein
MLAVLLLAAGLSGPDSASLAARRCDLDAYQAAVGQMEDDAFAAMKQASAAVASAARAGGPADAGDADWRRYKDLMAAAERARIAGGPILAACGAASPTAQAAPPARAEAATRTEQAPGAGSRFRLGLSEGYVDYAYGSATAIPVVRETGIYTVLSTSLPAPIVFPGGSLTPQSVSPTGAVVPLSTHAWERQHRLTLAYAPNGFGGDGFEAGGWRLSVEIGEDEGRDRERLGQPLVAGQPSIDLTATPVASCVIFSGFTGACVRFGQSVPFTRDLFQAPGAFNTPLQAQISSYDVRQQTQRFTTALGIDRALRFASPLGPLTVTVGAQAGGDYRSLTDQRSLTFLQQNTDTFVTASYQTRVDGPGYFGLARLAVAGRGPSWAPIGWSLFGHWGREWMDLEVHNAVGASAALQRTASLQGLGAGLSYALTPALGLALTAERQRSPVISPFLAPVGTAPGVETADGSGLHVDVRGVASWRYALALHYGF